MSNQNMLSSSSTKIFTAISSGIGRFLVTIYHVLSKLYFIEIYPRCGLSSLLRTMTLRHLFQAGEIPFPETRLHAKCISRPNQCGGRTKAPCTTHACTILRRRVRCLRALCIYHTLLHRHWCIYRSTC